MAIVFLEGAGCLGQWEIHMEGTVRWKCVGKEEEKITVEGIESREVGDIF
jgi:hypothetical protein